MMDLYSIIDIILVNILLVTINQWLQLSNNNLIFLSAKVLQEYYRLEINCYKNYV